MKSTKNSYEKVAHFSLFKMEEAHTSSSCCDVIIYFYRLASYFSYCSRLIFIFKEIALQHIHNFRVRHSLKKYKTAESVSVEEEEEE